MRISKLTMVAVLVAFLLMAGMTTWGGMVVNHLNTIDEEQRLTINIQDKFIQEQQRRFVAALRQMTEYKKLLDQQGPY